MPLFEKNTSSCYAWAIWKTDESSEILHSYLTKDYSSELAKFSSEIRKQDFLAARLLIKLLAGEEKEIDYYPSGKPVCRDNSFCVSISNTKNYVAVIIHATEKVGIDVEYFSPRVLKVKTRFLNSNELAHVDPENEIAYLLLCWSAKESMFKALNRQEVVFSKHLHLQAFDIKKDKIIKTYETKTTGQLHFDVYFKIYPDFVFTVIQGSRPV